MRKKFDALTDLEKEQLSGVIDLNYADPDKFEYEVTDYGRVLYADFPKAQKREQPQGQTHNLRHEGRR